MSPLQAELAASVASVEFSPEEVAMATEEAAIMGASLCGEYTCFGQTRFDVQPVLSNTAGHLQLHICVFNMAKDYRDPDYSPDFSAVLITDCDSILAGTKSEWAGGGPLAVIPLSSTECLVGSHIELVE